MEETSKKILIVEDDPFIRDIYIRVFEREGYKVVPAEDGEIAIRIANENPDAAVLLLDIMLPKMNGIDVLRQIKSQDATKNIPVILLTNLGEDTVLQEGYNLGAVGNILKVNLTPPEVVDHVKAILEKKEQSPTQ